MGSDVIQQSYSSTAVHCTYVRFPVGTIYHLLLLLPLLALRAPILGPAAGNTLNVFSRVLSGRGLALRFFLQDKTREHPSTSPRHLRTKYCKRRPLMRRASSVPSSVRVSWVPGAHGIRGPGDPALQIPRFSRDKSGAIKFATCCAIN